MSTPAAPVVTEEMRTKEACPDCGKFDCHYQAFAEWEKEWRAEVDPDGAVELDTIELGRIYARESRLATAALTARGGGRAGEVRGPLFKLADAIIAHAGEETVTIGTKTAIEIVALLEAGAVGEERAPEVVLSAIKDTLKTMKHARVFVGSREKMHPTGQSLYDDNVASLEQLLAVLTEGASNAKA